MTKATLETEYTLNMHHSFYCDDTPCRSPSLNLTDQGQSTSADQAEQERPAGPDQWDSTTISPEH